MAAMTPTPHRAVLGKDRKGQSLYAIAAARVGQNRARAVMSFVMQWSIALDALGVETLTLADYREYWGETQRTAFRRQSEFRAAFPGQQDPTQVVFLARSVWHASTGVTGLSDAVVPITA
jgi:hypothetical protein